MTLQIILLALLRHGITAAGGATFVAASGDTLTQLAGGLAAVIGFAWSIFEKRSRYVK